MSDTKNKIQKTEDNILIVKVQCKNKVDAYKIVSELNFEFEVLSAKFNGVKEKFDKKNTPFHFMKDNKKNKKKFRDIKAERNIK